MLSDPEGYYDSSFDGVDVGGLPASASTLKSRDGKESWSIALITSSQGITSDKNVVGENRGPTRCAFELCLSASISSFLFFRTNFLEEICKWTNKKGRQI